MGAIRQDTVQHKVFYIPAGSAIEQLLYDFSLQVGDTITGYLANVGVCSWGGVVVTSIDSILIGSEYRKRLNVAGDACVPGSFIEGIGGDAGLLEHFHNMILESSSELMCFVQDEQTLYPDSVSVCELHNNIVENDEPSIKTYPIPADDVLYFELPAAEQGTDLTITCSDLIGRTHLLIAEREGSRIKLNTEKLSNGLYILETVIRGNAKVAVQVLIAH